MAGVRIDLEYLGMSGVTDSTGTLIHKVRGSEGLGVAVTAHCPEGYRLAEAPRPVYLRTVTALGSDQLEPIEMSVSCMPTKRRAVVVVSTGEDGAGLPVLLDGLEVIKTDDAGVAHLRFTGTPSTPFRVTVDTSSNEISSLPTQREASR